MGLQLYPASFLTDGFLEVLDQQQLLLYIFLVLAAHRHWCGNEHDRVNGLIQWVFWRPSRKRFPPIILNILFEQIKFWIITKIWHLRWLWYDFPVALNVHSIYLFLRNFLVKRAMHLLQTAQNHLLQSKPKCRSYQEVKMAKMIFLLFALTIICITIYVCWAAITTLWRK